MARSIDEIHVSGWRETGTFTAPNYDVLFTVRWTGNDGVKRNVSNITLNLRDQLAYLKNNHPDLLKDRLLELMIEAERLRRGV